MKYNYITQDNTRIYSLMSTGEEVELTVVEYKLIQAIAGAFWESQVWLSNKIEMGDNQGEVCSKKKRQPKGRPMCK